MSQSVLKNDFLAQYNFLKVKTWANLVFVHHASRISCISLLIHCSWFRIARKVAHYLGDVLEEDKERLPDNLLANGSKTQHC